MSKRPRVLVTLEGYSVEGGLDGAYLPATCYSPTIALGRHRGPGDAEMLWRDYERVLDLVPALGLDGVRLSLEWARLEPRRDVYDDEALARYRRAIEHARSLDLAVTVVLVDAAWPSWLGLEAWLLPWVVERVLAHARRVVAALGDVMGGLVVFSDPEALVTRGYLEAGAPPWRRGQRDDARSVAAQLARIVALVREDPALSSHLVAKTATLSLDARHDALARDFLASDADEVYVRSLLRGAGPTSAPRGLLVRRDDQWVLGPQAELLSVFA